MAWWAGGSPSPTTNNCYVPNWKTDISENLDLMQPVPLCKHVTFPARRRELLAKTSAGAPMMKISLFLLGKQHVLLGKFPPCFAKRLVCFASLRVGGQFVARATFLQRQTAFPGHALRCVTRLPREGMEQREEQCAKPLFSDLGIPHSARQGLRAEASFWKVCAFQLGRRLFSIKRCGFALLLCIVLATSCGHWPSLSRIESFKCFHLPNHFG